MKISFIIPSWHYFSDPFKYSVLGLYYTTILKNQLGDKAEISLIDLEVSQMIGMIISILY